MNLRTDLQIVPSNCNRDAVLALVVKQLKALGIPFVHDVLHATERLGCGSCGLVVVVVILSASVF